MSTRRVIVLVAESTDATDDLRHALHAIVGPVWKPLPEQANPRTTRQEAYTEAERREYVADLMMRSGPELRWLSATIIPEEL